MFIDYAEVIAANKMAAHPGSEVVTVATINGDTAWVPYEANMRISDLKRLVRDELNIDESKQKLLFNEQALKVCNAFYFDKSYYCRFGNFRLTFISRIFHFRIIDDFLNLRVII